MPKVLNLHQYRHDYIYPWLAAIAADSNRLTTPGTHPKSVEEAQALEHLRFFQVLYIGTEPYGYRHFPYQSV